MSERILAIDPGERVGWARAEAYEDTMAGCHLLDLEGHGITPLKDFAVKLYEVAGTYDTIIYEPYRIAGDKRRLYAHIGSDVPTLQLIGMIRLCGWLNPSIKLVSSGTGRKSAGRKYAAAELPEISEKIEAALATDHDSGHDGDALMHLAAYFLQEYV